MGPLGLESVAGALEPLWIVDRLRRVLWFYGRFPPLHFYSPPFSCLFDSSVAIPSRFFVRTLSFNLSTNFSEKNVTPQPEGFFFVSNPQPCLLLVFPTFLPLFSTRDFYCKVLFPLGCILHFSIPPFVSSCVPFTSLHILCLPFRPSLFFVSFRLLFWCGVLFFFFHSFPTTFVIWAGKSFPPPPFFSLVVFVLSHSGFVHPLPSHFVPVGFATPFFFLFVPPFIFRGVSPLLFFSPPRTLLSLTQQVVPSVSSLKSNFLKVCPSDLHFWGGGFLGFPSLSGFPPLGFFFFSVQVFPLTFPLT